MVLPRNDIHYSIIIFMVGCVPVSSRAYGSSHIIYCTLDCTSWNFIVIVISPENGMCGRSGKL